MTFPYYNYHSLENEVVMLYMSFPYYNILRIHLNVHYDKGTEFLNSERNIMFLSFFYLFHVVFEAFHIFGYL